LSGSEAVLYRKMELKDEIANELALAILIERRHAQKIDADGGRELIGKIKGALATEKAEDLSPPEVAEAAAG
jgi:hypothetical protein